MATIATWGTFNIDESELTSLKLTYGLRLPKLQTKYLDPIIQCAGLDIVSITVELFSRNGDTIYLLWSDRVSLATSLRDVTISGIDYGSFNLTRTTVEWVSLNAQMLDNGLSTVRNSELIAAKITLEGIQGVE